MSNEIDSLHRLAQKALNSGDMRSLHQSASKILELDKDHADACFLLSIVASAQGKFRQAIELVDRALASAPTQNEYLSQKAKFHSVLKEESAAEASADKALSLPPHSAITLDTLGVVYTSLGQYERARSVLAAAVERNQKNAQFHFNLATAEQFLGNSEAAKMHYKAAISLKPTFYRAYWSLSELEKDRLDGSRTSTLERLLSAQGLRPDDELYLSHALSREYEQNGEYPKALSILRKGKERRASQLRYSSERDEALFASIKRAFLSPSTDVSSTIGDGAIFIVGMPRSGTTLVERIISSHSEVESLGELQNFGFVLRKSVDSSSSSVLDNEIIEKAILEEPAKIGLAYMESVSSRRSNKPFFIDKLPLNFLYIGFIRRCLPAAKIICLRRNPLDTCLSNYRQLFAINHSYYNYHYRLEDTAKYFINFDDLMGFWQKRYGKHLYQASYESLIKSPKSDISLMLDYLGLSWQQSCLDFHKNKAAVATPSATQVREKLYTTAVGRWEKYEDELSEVKALFDENGVSYR